MSPHHVVPGICELSDSCECRGKSVPVTEWWVHFGSRAVQVGSALGAEWSPVWNKSMRAVSKCSNAAARLLLAKLHLHLQCGVASACSATLTELSGHTSSCALPIEDSCLVTVM